MLGPDSSGLRAHTAHQINVTRMMGHTSNFSETRIILNFQQIAPLYTLKHKASQMYREYLN